MYYLKLKIKTGTILIAYTGSGTRFKVIMQDGYIDSHWHHGKNSIDYTICPFPEKTGLEMFNKKCVPITEEEYNNAVIASEQYRKEYFHEK